MVMFVDFWKSKYGYAIDSRIRLFRFLTHDYPFSLHLTHQTNFVFIQDFKARLPNSFITHFFKLKNNLSNLPTLI